MSSEAQTLMRGQNLDVICEASDSFAGARFYLYKDGGESFIASHFALYRTARTHFTLLHVSTSDSGNYSCSYQAWIAGRKFTSALSDPVWVTVN
eukprot:g14785.t1